MKYILFILKQVCFLTLFLSGFLLFIHFMNEKSWMALPSLVLWLGMCVIFLRLTECKKCKTCGNTCKTTGVAGNKYKQWYCKFCQKTFWTTLYLEDYE